MGSYRSNGHSQSDAQLVGQVARLLLFQTSLKLFSLQPQKHTQTHLLKKRPLLECEDVRQRRLRAPHSKGLREW